MAVFIFSGITRLLEMKWNESGFRPPLCTYRLNWARRTSWGWWDDWDDTVLQTQDSKFEPWRSEAEHATSRSRRLPTILTFTRGWGRNIFASFKPPRPGTEPRTLAWRAAVLTTTLRPPPHAFVGGCFPASRHNHIVRRCPAAGWPRGLLSPANKLPGGLPLTVLPAKRGSHECPATSSKPAHTRHSPCVGPTFAVYNRYYPTIGPMCYVCPANSGAYVLSDVQQILERVESDYCWSNRIHRFWLLLIWHI